MPPDGSASTNWATCPTRPRWLCSSARKKSRSHSLNSSMPIPARRPTARRPRAIWERMARWQRPAVWTSALLRTKGPTASWPQASSRRYFPSTTGCGTVQPTLCSTTCVSNGAASTRSSATVATPRTPTCATTPKKRASASTCAAAGTTRPTCCSTPPRAPTPSTR